VETINLETDRLESKLVGLIYRIVDLEGNHSRFNAELSELSTSARDDNELLGETAEELLNIRDCLDEQDSVNKGLQKELQDLRQELHELKENAKYAPLYYGVILRDGCAVHATPERGSPIKHVLNKDTRVMVMEIKENNGVNWAKIEDDGWIHGGWEYVHPPKIRGAE